MKKIGFFFTGLLLSVSLCAQYDHVGAVNEDAPMLDAGIPARLPDPVVYEEPPVLPPSAPAAEPEEKIVKSKEGLIAFLDLEHAFNNHPWTLASKEQFVTEIRSKAEEANRIQGEIRALSAESAQLLKEADNARPFYHTVNTTGENLPLQTETTEFNNLISYFVYGGADERDYSPVNSAEILEQIQTRVEENNALIKEKELQIASLRADGATGIRAREDEEVQFILQDIYAELKTYCKKRNIRVVVNKEDILFGDEPVNITLDFTDRLKKDKKKRPEKKKTEEKK